MFVFFWEIYPCLIKNNNIINFNTFNTNFILKKKKKKPNMDVVLTNKMSRAFAIYIWIACLDIKF